MTFFAKLTQCWSKVVISTTRRRIKFDVVVSVLQRPYEFDVSKNFWGSYFFKTLWISVSENLKSLFSRTRLHAYGWMHKKPESNKSLWGCLFNKLISNFLSQLQFDWRIYFRGELQHVRHMDEQKIKCGLIRAGEITEIRWLDKMYVVVKYTGGGTFIVQWFHGNGPFFDLLRLKL